MPLGKTHVINRLRPGDVVEYYYTDGCSRHKHSLILTVVNMPMVYAKHQYVCKCIDVSSGKEFYLYSNSGDWKFIGGHDNEMR